MAENPFEDGRKYERTMLNISISADRAINDSGQFKGKRLQSEHLLLRTYLAELEGLKGKYYPRGDGYTDAICRHAKTAINTLDARLKAEKLPAIAFEDLRDAQHGQSAYGAGMVKA